MKKFYLLLSLLLTLSLGACTLDFLPGSDDSTSTSSSMPDESISEDSKPDESISEDSKSDESISEDSESDESIQHVHTWAEVVYSWNGLDCTAETVCTGDDCQESLTETVIANYVKDTDATCYHNESGHF